jgi:hypothetical protein
VADSYPVALRAGLAADLAAHDHGVLASSYTQASTATKPGISKNGPDLPTTYDRALVITTLTPFDDGRFNRVTPVQFRLRGPVGGIRDDIENAMEAIRDLYDGREQFTIGDFTFRIALQTNSLYITADEKGRHGFFQTVHFHGRKV